MASNKTVTLAAVIQAKTKQFETAMRRSERTLSKFSKSATKTGKQLSAGLTLPLSIMGAASIKAFDEQAKAIAQVEQGLKTTGGLVGRTSEQLQKMAEELQDKTLFGDEDILQNATAQLLTFTNIAGQQFDRTQKAALDLATRLDGDLKSASIQLGKALNDPIANLSALSRSGIQFSDDQKQVIKALAETGRLAEAQTIILDELEKQYGGSAEAAVTGAGKIQQLRNSISDLGEEFGAIIVEGLEPVIDHIREMVRQFKGLDPSVKENIVRVAAFAAAAGPALWVVGKLAGALKTMRKGFKLMTNPIGLAVVALAALAEGIRRAVTTVDPLTEKLNALKNVQHQAAKAAAAEKTEIERLLSIARDEERVREDRVSALEKLQSKYPDYLSNLSLETINTKEATRAVEDLTAAIERRAQVQAAQERLVEIEKRLLDIQHERAEAVDQDNTVQGYMNMAAAAGGFLTGQKEVAGFMAQMNNEVVGLVGAVSELEEEEAALNAQKEALVGIAAQTVEQISAVHTEFEAGSKTLSQYTGLVRHAVVEMTKMSTVAAPQIDSNIEGPTLDTSGMGVLGLAQQINEESEKSQSSIQELAEALGPESDLQMNMQGMVDMGARVGESFEGLFGALMSGAADADEALQTTMRSIMNTIREAVGQAIDAFVAKAVAASFAQGSIGGPIAGAAAGALAAALFRAAIPAFATGGTVRGEQIVRVGDNPSGVEHIIPQEVLDRLRGSTQRVVVTGRLSGQDILLSSQRTQRLNEKTF